MKKKLLELKEEDQNELENLCKIIQYCGNENLSLNVYNIFKEKALELKKKNYDVLLLEKEAELEIVKIRKYISKLK